MGRESANDGRGHLEITRNCSDQGRRKTRKRKTKGGKKEGTGCMISDLQRQERDQPELGTGRGKPVKKGSFGPASERGSLRDAPVHESVLTGRALRAAERHQRARPDEDVARAPGCGLCLQWVHAQRAAGAVACMYGSASRRRGCGGVRGRCYAGAEDGCRDGRTRTRRGRAGVGYRRVTYRQ